MSGSLYVVARAPRSYDFDRDGIPVIPGRSIRAVTSEDHSCKNHRPDIPQYEIPSPYVKTHRAPDPGYGAIQFVFGLVVAVDIALAVTIGVLLR